jgi:hypothetical protein
MDSALFYNIVRQIDINDRHRVVENFKSCNKELQSLFKPMETEFDILYDLSFNMRKHIESMTTKTNIQIHPIDYEKDLKIEFDCENYTEIKEVPSYWNIQSKKINNLHNLSQLSKSTSYGLEYNKYSIFCRFYTEVEKPNNVIRLRTLEFNIVEKEKNIFELSLTYNEFDDNNTGYFREYAVINSNYSFSYENGKIQWLDNEEDIDYIYLIPNKKIYVMFYDNVECKYIIKFANRKSLKSICNLKIIDPEFEKYKNIGISKSFFENLLQNDIKPF